MNYQPNLRAISLHIEKQLYENYLFQAQKQGSTITELILDALQYYAENHFYTTNSMKAIDFSRTVTLKTGASDFINDVFWKEEFSRS